MWRRKVVPIKSLETTGKQSSFAKEVKSVRSGGVGFRRAPEMQPVIVRTPQAASGPMPAGHTQGNAAQRNAGPTQQSKINKVAVTGRLGRNAIVRETKNGRLVANFSVAVDESCKDLLGETHKKTVWHRVQLWEELAETLGASLQKGVRVYIEGRRAFRNWIDRENKKHCYTEIVASDVRFLDPPPAREAQNARQCYAAA